MSPRFGFPAALASLLLAAPSAGAITGVCPDGSIFIVQTADAVPCRDAKRVDPHDVPPLQPEMLPRPYGWERFNRRSDPNNPYNLVDSQEPYGTPPPPGYSAPPPPGYGTPPPTGYGAPPPPAPSPAPSAATAAPPQVAAAPAPATPRPLDLALSRGDVADLDEIVVLMQSVAPATLSHYAPDGERLALLQIALSRTFEQRMHDALARQGAAGRGPVVLFRAEARRDEDFHGNLTFVQGHVAFHPDPANPDQFGVIDGALGPLASGQRVLGYAVLPEHLDPAQPVDVYWDDRRITTTLAP